MSKRKKTFIKNRVILLSMLAAAITTMFSYQVNTPVCAVSTVYMTFALLVNCLAPTGKKSKKRITIILPQNCEECKGARR